MFGILLFNKPLGWTSNDVVRKLQAWTHIKKIGHGGALDPGAEGVLVIGINKEGTGQLSSILNQTYKTYRAVVTLGGSSSTDDSEGEIIKNKIDYEPTLQEVENCLTHFVGSFEQVPPIYSAIKVGGVAAYSRARNGERLDYLSAKTVYVEELRLIEYQYPDITLELVCGSGFYVRAFARDMGKMLGVGGYLKKLQRTRIFNKIYPGIDFLLNECVTIEDVKQDFLCMEVVIRGRVQRVGFQVFVQVCARELGIGGYVRNNPDDSVVIVSEGSRVQLEMFLEKIKIGPLAMLIEKIEVVYKTPHFKFKEFSIHI
jgi:tRNA pseudouridine55 synthase